MKNVSILVPKNSFLQAIADPQYCFTAVNQFLTVSGSTPLFNVQLVGLKKEVYLNERRYSVHTDKLLKEVKKTDLIFIPALFGDMPTAVASNKKAVPGLLNNIIMGPKWHRCVLVLFYWHQRVCCMEKNVQHTGAL
ncbi:MAG: hypothetical protein ABI359_14485 [Ginsengibacter sp.]